MSSLFPMAVKQSRSTYTNVDQVHDVKLI